MRKILLLCICAIVGVGMILLWFATNQRTSDQLANTSAPAHLASAKDQSQSESSVESAPVKLRFDTSKHPFSSTDAARSYYDERRRRIVEFHGPSQVENVLEGLKGTAHLLRYIGRAARQETIEAVPMLTELLDHEDVRVQKNAAEALARLNQPSGFEFLIANIANDSDAYFAKSISELFKENPQSEFGSDLRAVLDTLPKGSPSANYVATALAYTADSAAVEYFKALLTSIPNHDASILYALSEIKEPRVAKLLQWQFDNSESLSTRIASAASLAKLGKPSHLSYVTEAAEKALTTANAYNRVTTPDGQEKIESNPDYETWQSENPELGNASADAIRALGDIDAEEAVILLAKIAEESPGSTFRSLAIQSLAKIGDKPARNALWQLSKSTKEFKDQQSLAQALSLFSDNRSNDLSSQLFAGNQRAKEKALFFAETRGWQGLFELDLFY